MDLDGTLWGRAQLPSAHLLALGDLVRRDQTSPPDQAQAVAKCHWRAGPGWRPTRRWEVLRVLAPPAAKPLFTVNKWGLLPNMDLDEYARLGLESLEPAQDIHSSRTTIGGLPAFRTDYMGTHSMTANAMLSIRAYGLIQPPVGWVFRFGNDDIARDAPVFDAIAETIQVT